MISCKRESCVTRNASEDDEKVIKQSRVWQWPLIWMTTFPVKKIKTKVHLFLYFIYCVFINLLMVHMGTLMRIFDTPEFRLMKDCKIRPWAKILALLKPMAKISQLLANLLTVSTKYILQVLILCQTALRRTALWLILNVILIFGICCFSSYFSTLSSCTCLFFNQRYETHQ